MDGISRRRLLKSGGAAATIGASSMVSGCVSDVAGGGGLKIGVIQPYSGNQTLGAKSTWGFLSGLSRVYGENLMFKPDISWAASEGLTFEPGDGDRTYEFLFRDTVFDPSNARAAAEDLVLDEDVDILFGVVSSNGMIRVIENVAKPTDTLYVTGAGSTMDIIEDPDLCGRKIFRANEHTGMEARALSKYIGEEASADTIYLMAPDNSFGKNQVREYRKTLRAQGVDVVGERLFPSGFGSFRELFADIDDQADGMILGLALGNIQNALRSFTKANASGTIDLQGFGALPGEFSVSLMHGGITRALDEVTAESVREEANIRALASSYHWNQYDNSINDDLVSSFREAYGMTPAFFASGTYAAGYAIAQAVEETGSQDPDDIAEAMYGMTVEETPKGEGGYVFQEHNNQAKSEMTVANLVPDEEGAWNAPLRPSEPLMRVSADEAAVPRDDPDMECDLTSQ